MNIDPVDGLKQIQDTLDQVAEEERQRIFTWLQSKYKFNEIQPDVEDSRKKKIIDPSGASDESLKDFIARKKPNSFYERIACIAYYLEKNKGFDGIKTVDITKANTEARLNKFPDPSKYVEHATSTYGYLTSIGKGKKGISHRGEAVVEALPDREAVKSAHDENLFKKKVNRDKKDKTK